MKFCAVAVSALYYGAMWCNNSTFWCITVYYSALQYKVHHTTMQCFTVHYSAVQCRGEGEAGAAETFQDCGLSRTVMHLSCFLLLRSVQYMCKYMWKMCANMSAKYRRCYLSCFLLLHSALQCTSNPHANICAWNKILRRECVGVRCSLSQAHCTSIKNMCKYLLK